jgi:16S rRNA (uracil1498-N3)-methyltransferase
VPEIGTVAALPDWLRADAIAPRRYLLSLGDAARFDASLSGADDICFLSGPEGGLSDAEEAAARRAGFEPLSLGARVLRADTAPLAVLAALALR